MGANQQVKKLHHQHLLSLQVQLSKNQVVRAVLLRAVASQQAVVKVKAQVEVQEEAFSTLVETFHYLVVELQAEAMTHQLKLTLMVLQHVIQGKA